MELANCNLCVYQKKSGKAISKNLMDVNAYSLTMRKSLISVTQINPQVIQTRVRFQHGAMSIKRLGDRRYHGRRWSTDIDVFKYVMRFLASQTSFSMDSIERNVQMISSHRIFASSANKRLHP